MLNVNHAAQSNYYGQKIGQIVAAAEERIGRQHFYICNQFLLAIKATALKQQTKYFILKFNAQTPPITFMSVAVKASLCLECAAKTLFLYWPKKNSPLLFYNICGFIKQNRKCSMMSIGQTLTEIRRYGDLMDLEMTALHHFAFF